MYRITFKLGRKIIVWYRFAANMNVATISANAALVNAFNGRAKNVKVEDMTTEEIDAVKLGWVA